MAWPPFDGTSTRSDLLNVAMRAFAEKGVASVTTAAITRAAGLAEGTLFRHFRTKADLINCIYVQLHIEVADALFANRSDETDAHGQLQTLWIRYVYWGFDHYHHRKALAQLEIENCITAESRDFAAQLMAPIEKLIREGVRAKYFKRYPAVYITNVMTSLMRATVESGAQDRRARFDYAAEGFETFWAAVAARRRRATSLPGLDARPSPGT